MIYKYKTLDEIKQLPKYKELIKSMSRLSAEPTQKNIHEVYPFYEWYIEQCIQCEEICTEWEKEYGSKFVDVKDMAFEDKNVFTEEN